jgi:chromosome partitioning protein
MSLRSVALANQKGGVGKTTTAVHLAHGLALAGQRVVLMDLDPQGNATVAVQAMFADPSAASAESSREQGAGGGQKARLLELRDGLRVLPSPGASQHLPRGLRLDVEGLVELVGELEQDGTDWVVVDCPPRMDQWGWAGLRICREVLIPVPPEFFPMHGLSQMMQTLAEAREEFPGQAQLLGVLVTMLDRREAVARDVLADLRQNLGVELVETTINRDPKFVEAASHGLTLFEYQLFSKGARSYGELVREVLHGRSSPG